MKLTPLILASASPRRVELLRQIVAAFEVVPDRRDRTGGCTSCRPYELCQLNAHRKARAVAKRFPDTLVLAADTLVFLES